MKDATVQSLEARKELPNAPRETRHTKLKRQRGTSRNKESANTCGKDHQWGKDYCTAYGKQCKECLKLHVSRMCKSSSKGKPKGAVRKLHVIESQSGTDTDSDEFDSHDEYVVSTMTLTPQTAEARHRN